MVVVVAAGVIITALTALAGLGGPSCMGAVGFNWPNAGRVYVAGLTQQSTSPEFPQRPFTVAHSSALPQVRIFLGVDAAITTWRTNPATAFARMQRLVSDADTQHVQLIVSNYPDQPMISALAGHDYPSSGAAQRDLTTPGSLPYVRFGQWLAAVVPRFTTDPAIASWEVVNEPGYMLGIDDGTVNLAAGLAFVEHYSKVLHDLGARTVNGGGRPVFNPMTLTDQQLAGYTNAIDVLDDHLYPRAAPGRPLLVSTADAHAAVAAAARWFDRARLIARRPALPAMLGEVGSVPTPWFTTVQADATARGWPVFAWAFDAYDDNNFTDHVQPATIGLLADAAHRAEHVNGPHPVLVATPQCRPGP